MLKLTRHISFLCLMTLPFFGFAQSNPNDKITIGNSLYDDGKFGEAEATYKEGQTEGADPFISGFNLGDALFKQERYEEAASAFQALPNLTDDKEQKAAAFHNLGNSFIKAQKFQEGVDAYKQSLRNNPKDLDTKYNLAYAKRMLQQQQEQQQQDQQNKDEEKKDDQEQKQDQQQQQDQKQDEEKKEDQQQQQQEQKDQEQQEQQEQQQPKEGEISKEDAERMLDALNQDEKEIRDRLEKQKVKKGTKGKIEKDW
ncbi:MAG: tetratricopeptide repeat protein [Flavobacteriales bacterium]